MPTDEEERELRFREVVAEAMKSIDAALQLRGRGRFEETARAKERTEEALRLLFPRRQWPR